MTARSVRSYRQKPVGESPVILWSISTCTVVDRNGWGDGIVRDRRSRLFSPHIIAGAEIEVGEPS